MKIIRTLATMAATVGLGLSIGAAPASAVLNGSDSARLNGQVQLFVNRGFSPPDFTCGGTLISTRWILTARHCITSGGDFTSAAVYTGSRTLGDGDYYRSSAVRINVDHDVALLRTDAPVKETQLIKEYRGLSAGPVVRDNIAIRGWGGLELGDQLQVGSQRMINQNGGRKSNINDRYIFENIGAGFTTGGDSGGGISPPGDRAGISAVISASSGTYTQAVPTGDVASWILQQTGIPPR